MIEDDIKAIQQIAAHGYTTIGTTKEDRNEDYVYNISFKDMTREERDGLIDIIINEMAELDSDQLEDYGKTVLQFATEYVANVEGTITYNGVLRVLDHLNDCLKKADEQFDVNNKAKILAIIIFFLYDEEVKKVSEKMVPYLEELSNYDSLILPKVSNKELEKDDKTIFLVEPDGTPYTARIIENMIRKSDVLCTRYFIIEKEK